MPTAVAVNPQEPFAINVSVTVGTGTTADRATIAAAVQGPTGVALVGVPVSFVTTAGTLTPAATVTGHDGIATTTLVSRVAAQVSAIASGIVVQREVNTQAPSAAQTATPTPAPGPSPAPDPVPGNLVLNLPVTGTTNVAVNMFVSGPSNAGPISWDFGDGQSAQTDPYATSHTYASAGGYTVTATGIGIGKASSAKITIATP
jgi:PKD repeat protein